MCTHEAALRTSECTRPLSLFATDQILSARLVCWLGSMHTRHGKQKVTIRAEVLRLWTATSIRGSENSTYMIFHERLRYLLNPALMLMDDPLKGRYPCFIATLTDCANCNRCAFNRGSHHPHPQRRSSSSAEASDILDQNVHNGRRST
jgi:hypothetical protein